MDIMKYRTTTFNGSLFHCRNLSQYLKRLYKLVSKTKSNLKSHTVTYTKDTYEIPNYQMSITECLTLSAPGGGGITLCPLSAF